MSKTQNVTKKIQKGVNPQKEELCGTTDVLKGMAQAFKENNDTKSAGMVIGEVHGDPSSICHLVSGTLNIEKEKHSPNSLVFGRAGVGMSFAEKAKVIRENTVNTVELSEDISQQIKYMFTLTGGGWGQVSKAYFVTDDKIYFADNFSEDEFMENGIQSVKFTKVVVFDSTDLDFAKHGNNVGFDAPEITMYACNKGKYEKLWSVGDYRNSDVVDVIRSKVSKYETGLFAGVIVNSENKTSEEKIEFKNLNPTATEKQLFLHFGLYLVENNEEIKRYAVVHTNCQHTSLSDFPTTLSVELKYIEWDSGVEFFIDLEMFKIINLSGDFELLKLLEDRMRELQGDQL